MKGGGNGGDCWKETLPVIGWLAEPRLTNSLYQGMQLDGRIFNPEQDVLESAADSASIFEDLMSVGTIAVSGRLL